MRARDLAYIWLPAENTVRVSRVEFIKMYVHEIFWPCLVLGQSYFTLFHSRGLFIASFHTLRNNRALRARAVFITFHRSLCKVLYTLNRNMSLSKATCLSTERNAKTRSHFVV